MLYFTAIGLETVISQRAISLVKLVILFKNFFQVIKPHKYLTILHD